MVPIHDTDLATERWNKNQWNQFALWEKTEHKERKRRYIWLSMIGFLFLCLSSVPIVMLHSPKWITRGYATLLAIQINRVKQLAIVNKTAVSLRFIDLSAKTFVLELSHQCQKGPFQNIASDQLLFSPLIQTLIKILPKTKAFLVPPSLGPALGIFHLSNCFCFDPIKGAFYPSQESLLGFAFSVEPIPEHAVYLEKENITTQQAFSLLENFLQQLSITLIQSELAVLNFD